MTDINADLRPLNAHLDAIGWMRVRSGIAATPLDMQPEMFLIEDIAHSLARLCRYNGHCRGFISVGQHSIRVANWLNDAGRRDLCLEGLLHDVSEVYLGDMVRPLKEHPTFGPVFKEAEHEIERVAADVFGLVYPFDPMIWEADRAVLAYEMEHLRDVPYYDDIDFTTASFLGAFKTYTEERSEVLKQFARQAAQKEG